MAQHWLVRREAIIDAGGYSETYPNALEFDLLLRLVEQNGLNCLAHMDEYLVIGQERWKTMADDALATLNPAGGVWTYWDYQAGAWQRDHGFRIDHALLSPELADRLVACGVDKAHRGREKASDHAPVWVEIAPTG